MTPWNSYLCYRDVVLCCVIFDIDIFYYEWQTSSGTNTFVAYCLSLQLTIISIIE